MSSVIPAGSTVLVTGANGYIASHIVEQLLEQGYKVRGTVRNPSKMSSLIERWDKKFGAGKFEVVSVADISAEGAFDAAAKGVSAIAHVATVFDPTGPPEATIDPVVNSTNSILRTAAKEPSVKRVVLTSSTVAADWPKSNVEYTVTEQSWNDASIANAYNLPAEDPSKVWQIYSASKALGEKAAWKFVEENKPGFVLNTVLPAATFGPKLVPDQTALTSSWITGPYNGDVSGVIYTPPQHFIDVRDNAAVHVKALTDPNVSGVRTWAACKPYNVNVILQTLRRLYPERSIPADVEGIGSDLSTLDNKRAKALLGEFRTLEETIKASIEALGN